MNAQWPRRASLPLRQGAVDHVPHDARRFGVGAPFLWRRGRPRRHLFVVDHGKVPNNERRGAPGMSTDLTERNRIEQELRESEERFRLAFDEAPIGMALVTLDGH